MVPDIAIENELLMQFEKYQIGSTAMIGALKVAFVPDRLYCNGRCLEGGLRPRSAVLQRAVS